MGPPALGHTLGLVLMHGQRLVVAHDSSADMRLDISIVLESLLQNLDGLVPHGESIRARRTPSTRQCLRVTINKQTRN